jgi:hypothetical protein
VLYLLIIHLSVPYRGHIGLQIFPLCIPTNNKIVENSLLSLPLGPGTPHVHFINFQQRPFHLMRYLKSSNFDCLRKLAYPLSRKQCIDGMSNKGF